MTTHTDQEFEIVRKACHLWQEAAQTWEQRALSAEAKLADIQSCAQGNAYSQILDQLIQEILDRP